MERLSGTALVVLGLLALRARNGYEIKQTIDKTTRFFWNASYGQIYPELRRLADAGLVERASCSSDLRVTYAQLTDAGREKLEAAASAHTASICALLEEHFETGDLDAIAEILGKLPGVTDGDDSCSPG